MFFKYITLNFNTYNMLVVKPQTILINQSLFIMIKC